MKTFTRYFFGTLVLLVSFTYMTAQNDACLLQSDLPPHVYEQRANTRSMEDIYVIPVVFHLVGDETITEDIDDYQLGELIFNVNKILQGTNENILDIRPEFEPVIGQANIKLEVKNIIRVDSDTRFELNLFGSLDNLEKVKFEHTGGSTPENTNRHLNIWICDIFTSNGEDNNFILGYGTPPVGFPGWPETGWVQGIVLNESAFHRPEILVHEFGHYLGLRHISELFQGNCMDNDGIEDTPRSSKAIECGSVDTCPDDLYDMTENYMNAFIRDCRSVFTKGQVEFMRNTLEEYRPQLFFKYENLKPGPLPEFTMFPTRVSFQLIFVFKDCDVKIVEYKLYNQSGAFIESGKFLGAARGEVRLRRDLPTGMYFIQLEFEGNTYIKKFVKVTG